MRTRTIFINLKRFDVPKRLGGLCPTDDPGAWIQAIMRETASGGLGCLPDLALVYLLPEGLILTAAEAIAELDPALVTHLHLGCQGVHWQDVEVGGNFGAFTSSLPAKAARNLGARWSMIGHSEERRAKLQVMEAVEPGMAEDGSRRGEALSAVDRLIRDEIACALAAELNVLLCVGETLQQRGSGSEEEVLKRLEAVLSSQIRTALEGVERVAGEGRIVVGYEPIWAIGPGRTPPGGGYVAHAASAIKKVVRNHFGLLPEVVYGGGLKRENAGMLGSISDIDGGLVALTRFSGDIGFDVRDLREIIDAFRSAHPA